MRTSASTGIPIVNGASSAQRIIEMREKEGMKCLECGEPILSRRLGHCPACRQELPEGMRLSPSEAEWLDNRLRLAKQALRRAQRHDHGDEGFGLLGSGPRNYIVDDDD